MHCRLARNVSVLLSLLSSSIQVGSRSKARQNLFPRSRLLLFPLFTRVRLNNNKERDANFSYDTVMDLPIGVRTFRPRTIRRRMIRPFIVKNGISLFIRSWIYAIILG